MTDFSEYDLKIVILAQNRVLLDTLEHNFSFKQEPQILSSIDENIEQMDKIDILFIDQFAADSQIPEFKIRTIVNLSGITVSQKEIRIGKPCKFSDIAVIISNCMENDKVFSVLSDGWVFNESESCLQNYDSVIKLTEKETKILRYLAHSKSMESDKNLLFESVWKYSSNSETSTLETHLYKLRQKLPEGMLLIDGNKCKIACNNINRI